MKEANAPIKGVGTLSREMDHMEFRKMDMRGSLSGFVIFLALFGIILFFIFALIMLRRDLQAHERREKARKLEEALAEEPFDLSHLSGLPKEEYPIAKFTSEGGIQDSWRWN